MQRAAALVRPGPGDGGNAQRGVHVRGAVALAGEAVAEPEERALVAADQRRERFDIVDGEPGDRARPVRIARADMRLEPPRIVGVTGHIIAVGMAVAEQHVHHRAGERAVGPRPQPQRQIGLPHRLVVVDVDDDDLRAALLSRPRGVGHQIDLGRDRVGAPDHDAVGFGDFERTDAGNASGSRDIAGERDAGADRREIAGIALDVGQPFQPVAHNQAHRSRVPIGPDAFRAVLRLGRRELFRNDVERLVPADGDELAGALRPDAAERPGQPVGMVNPFGIARHFRAHDARSVALVPRAMDAPDARAGDHLDVERAHRWTIVRANRGTTDDVERRVHGRNPSLVE